MSHLFLPPIELAKVISNHAQVIIMDEPTSSLNDTEVKNLLNFVHKAASEGVAIFYISHKLDELFEVANRVVVLRDGKKTGELNIRDATKDELISRMVGRDLTDMYPKETIPIGDEILRVEGLETDYVKDISFSTRKGEIFGIYGLMGSGHQNVGTAIFGQDILHKGRILVHGKPVRIHDPMDAVNAGMAYCPAERKTEGLVLNQSVAVNIMSSSYCKNKSVFINYRKDEAVANKWIESLRIKTPSYRTDTVSLSGGNQQKVVLSKWLLNDCDVLIFDEPTRGIDVGAKSEIYKLMNQLVEEGKSIIMISSELPELLRMSDRVVVMCEGRKTGELDIAEATQEKIMTLATKREVG